MFLPFFYSCDVNNNITDGVSNGEIEFLVDKMADTVTVQREMSFIRL